MDKQKTNCKTLIPQSENIKLLNPGFETLSIEKLQTFPGYENLSEHQAIEVLDSIQQLAAILYGTHQSIPVHKPNIIDNQEVVYLNCTPADETPVVALHPLQKRKTA